MISSLEARGDKERRNREGNGGYGEGSEAGIWVKMMAQ